MVFSKFYFKVNSKQPANSSKGVESENFDFNIHFDDETPTEPLSTFEDDEAFHLSDDESEYEEHSDEDSSDNSDHHFNDDEFQSQLPDSIHEEDHDITTADHFNFDEEEHYDFDDTSHPALNTQSQQLHHDDFDADFDDNLDENDEFDGEDFDEETVVPQINSGGVNESLNNQSLEEELRELKNLPPIKMQSASNFNGTPQKDDFEEEHYDFEDDMKAGDKTNNSNNFSDDFDDNEHFDFEEDSVEKGGSKNNSNEDDFDFDEHDDEESQSNHFDDDEFPEDREEDSEDDFEDELDEGLDENPTSKEIAKMMHKQEKKATKEPKISKKIIKEKKTVSHHFDIHRTKIILLAILILISSLWAYASQVGFTTKTVPTFKDGIIKVLKTQGVQMQYTIRERLIFHKSEIDIQLNDITKMQIVGTASIASKVFSGIKHNLDGATFDIADAKINITSSEDINIPQAIAELSNDILGKMLEKVTINNSELTVTNVEGTVTNDIFVKNLTVENTPQKVSITGLILTNSQPVNINYSYIPSTKKVAISVKSSTFNGSLNGMKQTFGTSSKDSQIKGDAEIIVKNLEDFTNIFGISKKLTQNLKNIPQLTLQFSFDYSSLNHDLKITQGKVNALNSLGTFSLNTTPDSYQGEIAFDVISITDIMAKFQEKPSQPAKVVVDAKKMSSKKESTTGGINKNHLLNIFSVVTPAKPIEITMKSKNLSSQNESFFQNLETVFIVKKDTLTLKSLKLNAGDATTIEVDGEMNENVGFANINIVGQGNYKGLVSKITNIMTGLNLKKELTTEISKISFAIVQKKPSLIIDNISVEIQDTLLVEGSMQFTEHFTEGTQGSFFQSIKISNTDLNNFDIKPISFPQGVTIFQNVINENERNTSRFVTIINSKFKDITIKDATFAKETQKDIVSFNFDINAEEFQLSNSTNINIQSTVPTVQSETFIKNVASMQKFYQTMQSLFENNTIVIPSFEKLDGNMSFVIEKSTIFGKSFEKIQLEGNMKQGVLELVKSKFDSSGKSKSASTLDAKTDVDSSKASSDVATPEIKPELKTGEKPLSVQISGTVDLRRRSPAFDVQVAATNIPMAEFKTLLPFETNVDGSVHGGGSIAFVGTTYNEMLNTLKTNTKFVIQNATFSKLNLDFLGKHLVASHKNVAELDSTYIKDMFEKDSNTKANFSFSMGGEDKKFTIADCNIKTAYSGGVCYGTVTIPEDGKALVEVIAKFAVPALDINKSLKEVMKLYISSKIKQDSKACEITNDFSQINQYASYRKATFAI